jgi:prepilin peptidase CpaA
VALLARASASRHGCGSALLMAFDPNLLPLVGFAAVMIAAAVVDFRRLVIPNGLVLALCVLWLLHIAGARGTTPSAALATAAGAALALIGGAALFARGVIGGGDVKLFAAAALWAGAGALPRLLALTALIGGGLALLFLSPLGPRLIALRQAKAAPATGGALRLGRTPIPYGVAIAAAALLVTIPPYLD